MTELIHGDRTHEDYCTAIEAATARLVALVEEADPAAPVPTCPGWTIAKLVKHVGITQRWAEHLVRTRAPERLGARDVPMDRLGEGDDPAAWLAAGTARLLATLRATAPETPLWSWGGDRHARFWSRRMLHELLVHLADAELALGREPGIDAGSAIDGVDEFLGNLPYAAEWAERVGRLSGDGETLHLHATDAEGEWMITLRPTGFTWERGHGKGAVAVRGIASDLLLLVYGRLRPDAGRFEIFGDDRLLAHWLENSAI
ncbi:maleylpyruvate isomerase family mycothiol-dependent enzyme [Microtetraspora sp. AC03309]|uniref:maleylpyruvate isomerase family mycothiol-dependent enzyme n=1 Tax=Microtetraspora sp. AC03309 TaxID=2779376 RepID=UPI001E5887C7|nr:maleylpyruvate isomerase family mycothiol-dependent enzyme [Microtetraspora sp. AC03309]MCC5575906.1 maleylpyruvate isomerase family mycothiol-dependent enzyme [Microtetraspora sp. AC03309]